jgi:hypothetical protein
MTKETWPLAPFTADAVPLSRFAGEEQEERS